MIDIKTILSIPKPVDDKKEKLAAKKKRREQARRKFCLFNDKEREKLFNLIAKKFPAFEFHMSGQKLSKYDFISASSSFLDSYIFDLCIDISDSIKEDFNRLSQPRDKESSVVVKIDVNEDKLAKYQEYEEKRYVN